MRNIQFAFIFVALVACGSKGSSSAPIEQTQSPSVSIDLPSDVASERCGDVEECALICEGLPDNSTHTQVSCYKLTNSQCARQNAIAQAFLAQQVANAKFQCLESKASDIIN